MPKKMYSAPIVAGHQRIEFKTEISTTCVEVPNEDVNLVEEIIEWLEGGKEGPEPS